MPDKYEGLRLSRQLCFPIYLCAKEITRKYAPILEKLDLTYTQYVVMMYFWEIGQSNLKDMSAVVMLDSSTLTPILKKLEQKGYLNRMRDPADERSLIITLTPQGLALRDDAVDVPKQMGKCLNLSPQEAETLGALIYKALINIEKEL